MAWTSLCDISELEENKGKYAEIGGFQLAVFLSAGKVYVMDFMKASGEVTNDPMTRAELAGKERVLCLRASDGKELWKHEYDCPYKISYPAGPRTTPAVAGGKVYTLGAEGNLFCLDAETGKPLWDLQLGAAIRSNPMSFAIDGRQFVATAAGSALFVFSLP